MEKNDNLRIINPRVFRRSLQDIVLVWNTKTLDDSQKQLIKLSVYREDDWQNLEFMSDVRREKVQGLDKDTVMAIIPYKENKLIADEDYNIRITLGAGARLIELERMVYRFGTLPDSIKDDAKHISQMYGYNPKNRKWNKITLVEKDGVMCLPVYIMNLGDLNSKHIKK